MFLYHARLFPRGEGPRPRLAAARDLRQKMRGSCKRSVTANDSKPKPWSPRRSKNGGRKGSEASALGGLLASLHEFDPSPAPPQGISCPSLSLKKGGGAMKAFRTTLQKHLMPYDRFQPFSLSASLDRSRAPCLISRSQHILVYSSVCKERPSIAMFNEMCWALVVISPTTPWRRAKQAKLNFHLLSLAFSSSMPLPALNRHERVGTAWQIPAHAGGGYHVKEAGDRTTSSSGA
jgi:hypothetical protein